MATDTDNKEGASGLPSANGSEWLDWPEYEGQQYVYHEKIGMWVATVEADDREGEDGPYTKLTIWKGASHYVIHGYEFSKGWHFKPIDWPEVPSQNVESRHAEPTDND